MDVAIKKSAKLITQHSITVKPKRKADKDYSPKDELFFAKPEYCNWVDDAYLLLGKAHFYHHDYDIGLKSLLMIVNRFKNEEIKYEANLWIARTNIQKEKYKDAEEYINLVSKDKKHPKKLNKEINLIFADCYLKQKKYADAIKPLESALKLTKKKKEKARLNFILAQIYQKVNEFKKASEKYTEVIKLNPPYEMVFNAQINRAVSFDVGYKNGNELKMQLQKMLKDDKNIDFQDQIYYALASISMKENKKDEALEFFKKSVSTSISNTNQKAVSYLALADIYFAKPDYQLAGIYYDSTISYLDKKYTSYAEISVRAKSLSMLITNLNTIQLQDSVQKLALLSEIERNIVIDEQIQKHIDQENRKKNDQNPNYDPLNLNQTTENLTANSGKWYFYNPTLISFGKTEFLKKWGDRKIEDNWRRKNKAIVIEEQNNNEDNDKNNSQKNVLTDKSKREYYLKNIPLTDSALSISTQKIQEAYFNIGEIYSTKLNDPDEAIKNYENLNAKYPSHPLMLESFFQLYQLCSKIGRNSRAEYYKSEIIAKFPDSKYAKMFSNPNYLADLTKQQDIVENLYRETYSAYSIKDYAKLDENITNVEKNYKDNVLYPNFLLIKAIVIGEKGNQSEMKIILEQIIEKFPSNDIVNYCKDLIKVIESGTLNPNLYVFNSTSPHIYAILLAKGSDVNQAKFNLSSFNAEYSNKIEYIVINETFDPMHEIIFVKSFLTSTEAKIYFQKLNEKYIHSNLPANSYSHFVISQENYDKFAKDKQLDKYQKFFNENYK